ncbi:MAG: glycosyltransferase family 9 protein, partial [Verrucomicrobiota bacterium]
PLLHALRQHFPDSFISIGVGDWAQGLLAHNPDIDTVVPINAPWHNKAICKVPWNSAAGLKQALAYIRESPEVIALREAKYTVGIDVLGSPYGSLLMLAAGIPYRMGVRGYAGGHSACQFTQAYDDSIHVGRFALNFAETLGAPRSESVRPRIYLSSEEETAANQRWKDTCAGLATTPLKIIVAPGAGLPEKRWPIEHFATLCAAIERQRPVAFIVVGSGEDQAMGERIVQAVPQANNLCGQVSLRDTMALSAQAGLILSNASLMMHVAGAFSVNNAVLLGPAFDSAHDHSTQWGYEGTCMNLAPTSGRSGVASPEEVLVSMKTAGWL